MAKPALIAKITAAEGKRDDVIAVFRKAIDYVSASEPGTEVYVLHTDDRNADVVYFYELYADKDALSTHGGSDMMASVGKELAPLLAGRPELIRLTPVGGKGLSL
jgi:quinol monooxygenase YgiN